MFYVVHTIQANENKWKDPTFVDLSQAGKQCHRPNATIALLILCTLHHQNDYRHISHGYLFEQKIVASKRSTRSEMASCSQCFTNNSSSPVSFKCESSCLPFKRRLGAVATQNIAQHWQYRFAVFRQSSFVCVCFNTRRDVYYVSTGNGQMWVEGCYAKNTTDLAKWYSLNVCYRVIDAAEKKKNSLERLLQNDGLIRFICQQFSLAKYRLLPWYLRLLVWLPFPLILYNNWKAEKNGGKNAAIMA